MLNHVKVRSLFAPMLCYISSVFQQDSGILQVILKLIGITWHNFCWYSDQLTPRIRVWHNSDNYCFDKFY